MRIRRTEPKPHRLFESEAIVSPDFKGWLRLALGGRLRLRLRIIVSPEGATTTSAAAEYQWRWQR